MLEAEPDCVEVAALVVVPVCSMVVVFVVLAPSRLRVETAFDGSVEEELVLHRDGISAEKQANWTIFW